MKMVYLFEVMTILDDPQEILNYEPGQKLSQCGVGDWIAEYDIDCLDDALDGLADEYCTYLWDEEDRELEVCERGIIICEVDDGCIYEKGKVYLARIDENELGEAKEYLKGV